MKIKDVIKNISIELLKNGVDEYILNAEYIVSYSVGLKRLELKLFEDREVSREERKRIEKLLRLKLQRKPLSWVVGRHNFCGLEIKINNGVFVPRVETEFLADMVYKKSLEMERPAILDFCAGSGAIGLYVAYKNPDSRVFAWRIKCSFI